MVSAPKVALLLHSIRQPKSMSVLSFVSYRGVNFTLLYTSVAGFKLKEMLKNSEFKFYAAMTASFSLFIMLELIFRCNYEVEHAFRSSAFQVVSFITTTGLFSDDAAKWPHVTWVVLAACMFLEVRRVLQVVE